MFSEVEKRKNLMLTRLTPVVTLLIDTKQKSATTSFVTFVQ